MEKNPLSSFPSSLQNDYSSALKNSSTVFKSDPWTAILFLQRISLEH